MNLKACCLTACLVLFVNAEIVSADRRNNRAWNTTASEQVVETIATTTTTPAAGQENEEKQEEEGGGGDTTEPLRDGMAISYYPSRRERPPKVDGEGSLRLPGSSGTPTKPTKYHYYPHNQHIYLLPECAVQQVCNAVYIRLNYTQPLCACPARYREPCSASLNSDDLHTTELSTDPIGKVLTLVKTCEPVADMRICRSPRDWSLLALQNIRTGKSHYLVICRCPDTSILEGPMSHDQPTYASVPGIRVYGMMCVNPAANVTKRRGRPMRVSRSLRIRGPAPRFPWHKVNELLKTIN